MGAGEIAAKPGGQTGSYPKNRDVDAAEPLIHSPKGESFVRTSRFFDLCELRGLPGRNRLILFPEGPESCENPHDFRLEQQQDSVSSHTSRFFHQSHAELFLPGRIWVPD